MVRTSWFVSSNVPSQDFLLILTVDHKLIMFGSLLCTKIVIHCNKSQLKRHILKRNLLSCAFCCYSEIKYELYQSVHPLDSKLHMFNRRKHNVFCSKWNYWNTTSFGHLTNYAKYLMRKKIWLKYIIINVE